MTRKDAAAAKLDAKAFVLSAIHRLSRNGKPEHGLRLDDSGLLGALHLYYECKKPMELIWSLVKGSDVLLRSVKGDFIIYDPRRIAEFDCALCLCEAKVSMNKSPLDMTIALDAAKMLKAVFDWTEVAHLYAGEEIFFRQVRKIKGSSSRKGVSMTRGVFNNDVKFIVQSGDNDTCFEYLMSLPKSPKSGGRSAAILKAVMEVLEKKNVVNVNFTFADDKILLAAQEALAVIVPVSTQKEDVLPAAKPVDEGSVSDAPKFSDYIELGDTAIGMILLGLHNLEGFDPNKAIPKTVFTRVLREELVIESPSAQQLAGLVQRLANSAHNIIDYVHGSRTPNSSYLLTDKAKKILAELNGGDQKKSKTAPVEDSSKKEPSPLTTEIVISSVLTEFLETKKILVGTEQEEAALLEEKARIEVALKELESKKLILRGKINAMKNLPEIAELRALLG